ncbi:MAG: serine hydrolase domain-containing protein [Ilumatobacteraceae bacterium]
MKSLRLLVVPFLLVACSGSDAASTVTTAPPPVETSVAPTTAAPTTTPPTTVAPTTTLASPSGGVFPGADWETADLPGSVDRAALDAAVDVAFGKPDAAGRVRSIVIVQGGKITYERYHPLDNAETIMDSYSVAKSVTSSLIGILTGDGKLDVDAPAPVTEWADPADPRHEITLADLLHMSSGLKWQEDYSTESLVRGMVTAPVASAFVASQPLTSPPGTEWQYSTGTTAILAGILTDTVGDPAKTDEFIEDRLLGPIGITSMEFQRDRAGRWFGGFGANATTRDFARFGLLFLNDGVWNGQRLLPEGWVDYSRTPSPTSAQYGAQWWMLHDDAFEARGLFGQIVLVSQKNDVVIAINTTQGGDADTLVDTVYPLFQS